MVYAVGGDIEQELRMQQEMAQEAAPREALHHDLVERYRRIVLGRGEDGLLQMAANRAALDSGAALESPLAVPRRSGSTLSPTIWINPPSFMPCGYRHRANAAQTPGLTSPAGSQSVG